ncbi:hypothetical protein FB451DRAFT_1409829 [Mycena latifolia]|nr:hypothetical protein FB451DRAFT_1409829 [Mycena latifolia]
MVLITEDKVIKRSLFPPCGPNASTTQGGGKPKINAQWDLMAKITRAFDNEMGETGAGIKNASEIDMSVENSFTTKWAEILDSCPWYFDMRGLIAQRPNLVPTGVGHSSTGFKADVIIQGPAPSDYDEPAAKEELEDDNTPRTPIDWEQTPEPAERRMHKRTFSEINEEEGEAAVSGDDYEPSSPVLSETEVLVPDEVESGGGLKVKGNEAHRKRPAKPSTSKPAALAPTAAPKPSKKTKLAEFSEIAKSEEMTWQQEIASPNPSKYGKARWGS